MKVFLILYLFLPVVMSTPHCPIDINCKELKACYKMKCDLPDYPDFHRFYNLMTPDSCPDVSCKEMAECYMSNCNTPDYPDVYLRASTSCPFQCPRNHACQAGKCSRIARDVAVKSKKWPDCEPMSCDPGKICFVGACIDYPY